MTGNIQGREYQAPPDPPKLLTDLEACEVAARPECFKRKILPVVKFLEPIERDQLIFTAARLLKPAGVRVETIRKAVREMLEEDEPEPQEDDEKEKMTQAQCLVALASEVELFHDPEGNCFSSFPVGEHIETCSLKTKGFRNWLRRRFYEEFKKPPGAQALQDALGVLEARAQFDGPELPVYTRLAARDGNIYIDLCNEKWKAVEVTPAGWRVVNNPPVKFRRAKGMLPLPYPVAGGSIEELRRFVNVPDEAGWRLAVAWTVAAMRPAGPYPVLILQGEQGNAKSTTTRALRALVDPNTAPLRTIPRDERDLMIAANNGWVLSFDNLSGVQPWLSDAICRLATGGGFATRELHTDQDEVLFDAMRPLALNGIDELTSRHDLLDRALILNLPSIPEGQRQDEKTFWSEFEKARPELLGALLDAVAAGLRNIDKVKLDRLPRMADFAKWVAAAEEALPWPAGDFVEAYTGNRAEAVELALEADLVAVAVRTLLEGRFDWTGTAQELLSELARHVPESIQKTKAWPRTPKALGNRLRRAATFLRHSGVEVEFYREPGGSTGKRTRLIRLGLKIIVPTVPTVPGKPENPATQGFAGRDDRDESRDDRDANTRNVPATVPARSPGATRVRDDRDDRDAKKHSFSEKKEDKGDVPDDLPDF